MKRVKNVRFSLAGSVALATLLVYLPALRNELVNWDDDLYVAENPHIRSLDPSFFKWAFFDFYASNWHPLTWLSHALDYALWGLNPLGHHLSNIVLHAINAFLVVLLVIRLLEAWKERRVRNEPSSFLNERAILIAAGTTGLLFGLHPVHVESVAWVAERKDLLCALFFLLSIIAYTGYAKSVDSGTGTMASRYFHKRYLIALGLFILALLSKPMAVTLPIVLLVLDWHPFNRIETLKAFQTTVVEKLPFIVLSLGSSIVTVLAQREGEAIQSTRFAPLSTRLFVAGKSLIAYLGTMIWPENLVPYYPYPEHTALLTFENLLSLALVAGITAVCIVQAKKQRVWLSAWVFYVVTLLPVIGIVQVGGQAMADRYMYLPGLGPTLAMGLGAAWGSGHLNALARGRPIVKLFNVVVAVSVFASLSYLTVEQIGIWKNSIDFWNYVIVKEPAAPRAYSQRGLAYERRGRLEKAIEDFDKAITLDPYFVEAYLNRGVAYGIMGRVDDAINDFDKAIALDPSDYRGYFNRGISFEDKNQPDRATKDYDTAASLNPQDSMLFINRGILHGKAGEFDKAIDDFSRSITINPYDAKAFVDRGTAYALLGQYGRALDDYNQAILLDKENPMVYFNRGKLHLRTGDKGLASSDFRKACDLGSEYGCSALQSL